MIFHAIGLMSGSSLDGLDICFVRLTETDGNWQFEWLDTACIPYSDIWQRKLRQAKLLSVPDFLKLHTEYGHFTGKLVREFLERNGKGIVPDFIASHGHTIFHEPENATTFQLGDGASIAAETGLSVISDLRNMDVAMGGQGAPIVPLGEKLLFGDYDYWLNLGGICNISFRENGVWKAFDIGACNQVLNALAFEAGQEYDEGGRMAASGKVNTELLAALNALKYFRKSPPKSLDNSFSEKDILPLVRHFEIPLPDKLRTAVEHVAQQIDACVALVESPQKLLATGGGALNSFLIERLSALLQEKKVSVIVPDMQTVQYKEALIMALLGALRWMGKATVMNSVTGGRTESVGGAVWVSNTNYNSKP